MITLTQEELFELTERSQPAAQIRWLKDHSWLYKWAETDRRKLLACTSSEKWFSPAMAVAAAILFTRRNGASMLTHSEKIYQVTSFLWADAEKYSTSTICRQGYTFTTAHIATTHARASVSRSGRTTAKQCVCSSPNFSDAEGLHALHEKYEAEGTAIDFVCQTFVVFVDSDFLQAADQFFIAAPCASHFGLEQIGSPFVPFFMHGWSRRFLDCGEHSTFGWINPQI